MAPAFTWEEVKARQEVQEVVYIRDTSRGDQWDYYLASVNNMWPQFLGKSGRERKAFWGDGGPDLGFGPHCTVSGHLAIWGVSTLANPVGIVRLPMEDGHDTQRSAANSGVMGAIGINLFMAELGNPAGGVKNQGKVCTGPIIEAMRRTSRALMPAHPQHWSGGFLFSVDNWGEVTISREG